MFDGNVRIFQSSIPYNTVSTHPTTTMSTIDEITAQFKAAAAEQERQEAERRRNLEQQFQTMIEEIRRNEAEVARKKEEERKREEEEKRRKDEEEKRATEEARKATEKRVAAEKDTDRGEGSSMVVDGTCWSCVSRKLVCTRPR